MNDVFAGGWKQDAPAMLEQHRVDGSIEQLSPRFSVAAALKPEAALSIIPVAKLDIPGLN